MNVPVGELELKKPGPFKGEMHIYLEDNGIRTVRVQVSGTVKGDQSDAPP